MTRRLQNTHSTTQRLVTHTNELQNADQKRSNGYWLVACRTAALSGLGASSFTPHQELSVVLGGNRPILIIPYFSQPCREPTTTRTQAMPPRKRQNAPINKAAPPSCSSPSQATTSTGVLQPRDIKKRISPVTAADKFNMDGAQDDDDDQRPLLDNNANAAPTTSSPSAQRHWILFALASGACAAFNGVFAKLTTTELTSTFSQAIAGFFGLSAHESVIEVIVRSIFFGLNLVFNGVMWTLFTKALARGNSTTQVSIMNTSSNFVITAILGFAIFSEALPPLWWLGAAMLVAGNVIIGRKDEGTKTDEGDTAAPSEASLAEDGVGTFEHTPPEGEAFPVDKIDGSADEDLLDLDVETTR
ncbi:hypothetical protein B0H63DRAFT_467088 [Podospora didyma]|uniref:EamA domain-containing protein n=1 Tax=Podospora didyma TaxID=330526 RepID=A0AAE0P0C2_9PEZI|nr:hypothetical protein B0H63DRAFT_467088 [Podospora didyma]